MESGANYERYLLSIALLLRFTNVLFILRLKFFFLNKLLVWFNNVLSVQFNPDDVVLVLDDVDEVRHLQKGHGGWTDAMLAVCFRVNSMLLAF